MNKDNNEKLVFENYENEFSFEENKSNLNITFNRIAFIFFVFLVICLIYSVQVFYLGSLNSKVDFCIVYSTYFVRISAPFVSGE